MCGDFNCNLLDKRLDANFLSPFKALNLSPVNHSTPTHFTKESSSLLDLYLASDVGRVMLYTQLLAPGFSKHDLIFVSLDIACRVDQQIYQYRDYKNLNISELVRDLNCIDWNSIYLMENVNQQICFLRHNVNQLFDIHVPLKTRLIKHTSPPWLNGDISALMLKRDAAYSQWRRFKLEYFHKSYCRLRNQVVALIRTTKRLYYEHKVGPLVSGKKLWKNLQEIGVGKQSARSTDNIDCDALNKKFTSTPQSFDVVTPIDSPIEEESTGVNCSLNFIRIQEEDIVEAILSIKSNATGLDLMEPKFVKLLLPHILRFIAYIFNNILTTSEFPSEWKKAKIIPVPKKPTGIATEFRPIAILPFLSKVFEKTIMKQIQTYLSINNLLTTCQSGFRQKRSCKSALLFVTDEIRTAMDKDHITLLTLLDFSKAFDTVNHSILCKKLRNFFGFSIESCKLIHSYLSGRQQRVVANGQSSSFLNVLNGVPQGSILGPILFSLYINELPKVVKHCVIHLYADDVQLLISRPFGEKNDAVALMNEDLSFISRWSKRNHLYLNPVKSTALPIYRKVFDLSVLRPLNLENEGIEYVNSARNLGMIFNRTLTWNDHLTKVIGKIYGSLRVLQVTRSFIPTKTKLLLAKTLLLPIMLYGCEIFCNLDSATNRKLNVAYNNIARYVYNLRRYDHVSSFAVRISGCSLDNLLNFRSLSYLHEIIQTKQPDYLHGKLNFPHSTRSFALILPRYNFLITERQFFVHVIRLWNSLPISMRSVRSTRRFKCLLFNYLANH